MKMIENRLYSYSISCRRKPHRSHLGCASELPPPRSEAGWRASKHISL